MTDYILKEEQAQRPAQTYHYFYSSRSTRWRRSERCQMTSGPVSGVTKRAPCHHSGQKVIRLWRHVSDLRATWPVAGAAATLSNLTCSDQCCSEEEGHFDPLLPGGTPQQACWRVLSRDMDMSRPPSVSLTGLGPQRSPTSDKRSRCHGPASHWCLTPLKAQ
ncbi:hypothetical protein RRG08_031033 [Elysia crispata]|uniref:Uncharacterized protein n=1 Tax=Elysia crispata TaxID=231223 RepID=A0AAE1DEZ3_9GAST|nr:hypothetical protein RRG08_031033 [Elysia crispata]